MKKIGFNSKKDRIKRTPTHIIFKGGINVRLNYISLITTATLSKLFIVKNGKRSVGHKAKNVPLNSHIFHISNVQTVVIQKAKSIVDHM